MKSEGRSSLAVSILYPRGCSEVSLLHGHSCPKWCCSLIPPWYHVQLPAFMAPTSRDLVMPTEQKGVIYLSRWTIEPPRYIFPTSRTLVMRARLTGHGSRVPVRSPNGSLEPGCRSIVTKEISHEGRYVLELIEGYLRHSGAKSCVPSNPYELHQHFLQAFNVPFVSLPNSKKKVNGPWTQFSHVVLMPPHSETFGCAELLHSLVAIAVDGFLHRKFQWVEQQEVRGVPERDTVLHKMVSRDRRLYVETYRSLSASKNSCFGELGAHLDHRCTSVIGRQQRDSPRLA